MTLGKISVWRLEQLFFAKLPRELAMLALEFVDIAQVSDEKYPDRFHIITNDNLILHLQEKLPTDIAKYITTFRQMCVICGAPTIWEEACRFQGNEWYGPDDVMGDSCCTTCQRPTCGDCSVTHFVQTAPLSTCAMSCGYFAGFGST